MKITKVSVSRNPQIKHQYTQLVTLEKLLLLFEELIHAISEQIGEADKRISSQLIWLLKYQNG